MGTRLVSGRKTAEKVNIFDDLDENHGLEDFRAEKSIQQINNFAKSNFHRQSCLCFGNKESEEKFVFIILVIN